MQRFLYRSLKVWLVMLVVLTGSLLLLACGSKGPTPKENVPASSSQSQTQPTKAANAQATSVPAPSGSPQSRVSDSVSKTVVMDAKVLDSYHLETSGTEPVWDKTAGKVIAQSFTFKADVSGDNAHFVKTITSGKGSTLDVYYMNANKDGGKAYSVKDGAVQEDMLAQLTWVSLPLDYGLPLIFAAMGASLQGGDTIDGRAADKYDVDMSKAPAGADAIVKSFVKGYKSSKGTAWIDKQNGALLKMTLDYSTDVNDMGTVVGQGSGHIDWLVTNVGKVKVTLPPVSQGIVVPTSVPGAKATAAPTKAAQGAATPTPPVVATSTSSRVGQRVVKDVFALTVTKVDVLDTFGGQQADPDHKWVIATVTIENVSKGRTTVDYSNFDYVDRDGGVMGGILNGPSAPGTTGKDVLAYTTLTAGGKVQNKIILAQVRKSDLAGMRLLFTIDTDIEIVIDLGI